MCYINVVGLKLKYRCSFFKICLSIVEDFESKQQFTKVTECVAAIWSI